MSLFYIQPMNVVHNPILHFDAAVSPYLLPIPECHPLSMGRSGSSVWSLVYHREQERSETYHTDAKALAYFRDVWDSRVVNCSVCLENTKLAASWKLQRCMYKCKGLCLAGVLHSLGSVLCCGFCIAAILHFMRISHSSESIGILC